ncbi:MAG: MazG nucleotide pyrophosphohydrolase domain-containing protein, partial [bacterium]
MNHPVDELLGIMAKLRDPELGCPWDLKQDFSTIVPYTLEEAYEVAEAIELQDWDELKTELGDLLFQIVFYTQIASERDLFEFQDVVNAICEKMIRRHPHVFADQQYS